eukprot:6279437-Pyramimonas_sp.AAC.1
MAQGEPCMVGTIPDNYPCYWQHLLEDGSIPTTALCSMIGNSFHTVAMGLWITYCITHLRLKGSVEP